MAGVDPPAQAGTSRSSSELIRRVISALVLAPLAILVAYVGSWPFALFWGLAGLGVLWEWTALVAGPDRRSVLMAGGAAVVLATTLAASGRFVAAGIVIAMGVLAAAALAPAERRAWIAAGVPYAAAVALGPIILRSDHERGFLAIVFLFAVVWATDIVAYFSGRAFGGPKLMPRVSPKKTWSGALGGLAGAVVAGTLVAEAAGLPGLLAIGVVALTLSVLAQAGDLLESAVKRRFGAKDASQLIPGHGGLMDRLDGFLAAAALAAVIGLLRGGVAAPAHGLLLW